jgi:antimicrobial peptide system SdpA family protein
MNDDDARRKRVDRKLALAMVLGIAAFLLLFVYSAHGSMVYNPVRLPFEDRLTSRLFFPQGWKFFTKNADDPSLLAFKLETDGRWVSALLGANGERRNWFGFTRRARAQGVELGLLLEKVPTDWAHTEESRCNRDPASCLQDARSFRVRNVTPGPTLCGTVGIVAQKPVPWAWSRDRDRLVMPSSVIKLEVQC